MPREYTPLRKIEAVIGPSIAYVPLTQGRYSLIDAEDAETVGAFNWHASERSGQIPYARSHKQPMHRLLLGKATLLVDHINGRTLDNRRANLRLATSSQNRCNAAMRSDNTSGLRGVHWDKKRQKYVAQITENGKRVYLGAYVDRELAERVYRRAAASIQGQYTRS